MVQIMYQKNIQAANIGRVLAHSMMSVCVGGGKEKREIKAPHFDWWLWLAGRMRPYSGVTPPQHHASMAGRVHDANAQAEEPGAGGRWVPGAGDGARMDVPQHRTGAEHKGMQNIVHNAEIDHECIDLHLRPVQ